MKPSAKALHSVPAKSPPPGMPAVKKLLRHGREPNSSADKAKAVKDLGSTSGTSPPILSFLDLIAQLLVEKDFSHTSALNCDMSRMKNE